MSVRTSAATHGRAANGGGDRFVLAEGYTDPHGVRHREGWMRPATALDEMRVLGDFRVHLRPQAFLSVLLARVITRLGSIERVDAGVIDRLCEEDRQGLERLYRTCNGYPAGDGGRDDGGT